MISERCYKRPFVQFVKKAHRVYKFSFNRSQYLVAYQLTGSMEEAVFLAIEFIQVGSHEKFYESLKKYLREIKG